MKKRHEDIKKDINIWWYTQLLFSYSPFLNDLCENKRCRLCLGCVMMILKVLLDCPRFIPKLQFRKAINGFACKVVSLLFVYRIDVSSVTNVCAVLFPKRVVRIGELNIRPKARTTTQKKQRGCLCLGLGMCCLYARRLLTISLQTLILHS